MPPLPFTVESARDLPDAPGVYLFLGDDKRVLYVGKALSLRDRVRSYFSKTVDGRLVTAVIHRYARTLDFVLTESEKKALFLENSLIKKHDPRFNIRLRDDKTFFSLKLDLNDPWPWFQIVRRRKQQDGVLYFGPYASSLACRRTLDFLNTLFPMRTCTDSVLANRVRPCLSYEIKRCVAPCVGLTTTDEYGRIVEEAVAFLKGKNSEVVASLRLRMKEAAARLEFEAAAEIRDRIEHIERTVDQPHVTREIGYAFDVVGMARRANNVSFCVLMIRDGILAETAAFKSPSLEADEATLKTFLGQFYGGGRPVPAAVALPFLCEDVDLLSEILSDAAGASVQLVVPERGERRRLLALAQSNAEAAFAGEETRDAATQELLESLQRRLTLVRTPRRIECFDISNFQGSEIVASCAAFTDARADKQRYRRYRIRTVEGQDDFASMREVLARRLRRGIDEDDLPDLLVIDGGQGQLAQAVAVLHELKLDRLDVIGLAKARSGAGGALQIKEKERVFKPDIPVPIVLDQQSPELHLLVQVRDEAHRFAITYHRQLRAKAQTTSVLELVPGVGKKRAALLLRTFGSLAGVRAAAEDALAATPGMTRRGAKSVRQFFDSGGRLPDDSGLE
jgi:excinuclease ABC subunit C